MTTVYIETIECSDTGDKDSYFFQNEDDALREACSDLLNHISSYWDLSDSSDLNMAESIQDDVRVGRYRSALSAFNDHEGDRCGGPTYFSVTDASIRTNGNSPTYIDFSEYHDLDDEGDENEEEEDEEDDSPYQASSPGATCRGPCGNPSTDAYADQRDGTFLCYQCKLMGGVFGR